MKSLALSKENHRHITLLSVNQISEKSQQCSIKYFNKIIKVDSMFLFVFPPLQRTKFRDTFELLSNYRG